MNTRSKITAVIISLFLAASNSIPAFAAGDNLSHDINGKETIDEIIEEKLDGGNYTKKQGEEIAEEMQILDGLGLDISDIKEIETNDENIVYCLEVTDDITDNIIIDQDPDSVIMNVYEGEKHDELIIWNDGTMYLDGKEVIVETEDMTEDQEDLEIQTSETGGTVWYKKADTPSYLKNANYKSYPKNPSWKNGNVNLNKKLCNIAYATILAILLEAATGGTWKVMAAGGVKGFIGATLLELCTINPNSKNISYKDYIARGKNNARYLKCRRRTWASKNYQGDYATSVSYGLVQ